MGGKRRPLFSHDRLVFDLAQQAVRAAAPEAAPAQAGTAHSSSPATVPAAQSPLDEQRHAAAAGPAAGLPHVHLPAGCTAATAVAQEAAAEVSNAAAAKEPVDQPLVGSGTSAGAAQAATAGGLGPASSPGPQLGVVGQAAGLAQPADQAAAPPTACTAQAEAKPQQDYKGLVEVALGWTPPARPAEALPRGDLPLKRRADQAEDEPLSEQHATKRQCRYCHS